MSGIAVAAVAVVCTPTTPRLAIAVLPKDAANRIVLATDGNETAGNLLQAAEAAKALSIPIDVLPLRYKYDREVLVERLTAPAAAREGYADLRPYGFILLIAAMATGGFGYVLNPILMVVNRLIS